MLEEAKDGSWDLADGWELRRIYIYGNAKTIENMVKFMRVIQNNQISYLTSSVQ